MDIETLLKIAAVPVALSGWVKVFYDHYVSKPKITGKLLSVIKGDITKRDGSIITSYFVYPYLLNLSKNSVHILDYELYVRFRFLTGWVRVHRIYGAESMSPSFKSPGGGDIKFHHFDKNVINGKNSLVQFGVPLHGWVPFSGPADYLKKGVVSSKLVCLDAYGKRHVIKLKDKENIGLPLFMELSGIELPKDMLEGHAKLSEG